MAYAELMEVAKGLSEDEISEVMDFARFIDSKRKKDDNKVVFDLLKGGLIYMADDFDETPECLRSTFQSIISF